MGALIGITETPPTYKKKAQLGFAQSFDLFVYRYSSKNMKSFLCIVVVIFGGILIQNANVSCFFLFLFVPNMLLIITCFYIFIESVAVILLIEIKFYEI